MNSKEPTINQAIQKRWSPRAFSDRPVEPEKLEAILEAARWAPSSMNEQPWSFIVAEKHDTATFEKMAGCLVPGNAWARNAPVLILSVARLNFSRNDKPNRVAVHDVGLATENLFLQATELGLASHGMAGFEVEKAKSGFSIPDGFEPIAMTAIGYLGDPDTLPPDLLAREQAPRTRKPIEEIALTGWGRAWKG